MRTIKIAILFAAGLAVAAFADTPAAPKPAAVAPQVSPTPTPTPTPTVDIPALQRDLKAAKEQLATVQRALLLTQQQRDKAQSDLSNALMNWEITAEQLQAATKPEPTPTPAPTPK